MGTGNQREHQRAHPRLLSEEDRLHARAGCGDCRSGVCFEHETEKTAQVEDTFRSLEWCTSRLNVPSPNAKRSAESTSHTIYGKKKRKFIPAGPLGIEPRSSVLETDVLPLNYGPQGQLQAASIKLTARF